MPSKSLILLLLALPLTSSTSAQSIAPTEALGTSRMRWQFVGNPGNPGAAFGLGKVNANFLIGKYEVTNNQYAGFLNAKAAIGDPLELYNPEMSTHPTGGIVRVGVGTTVDPYVYLVLPFMGSKPANFVSFYDAMRFSNWMHNGMGSGDTESGSYLLLGGTPIPTNGTTVVRGLGARVVVPTEHEWYKAGHYNPATLFYSSYATGTSTVPTPAAATPTGGVFNPGANVVNYLNGADWGGQDGNVTTVGGAGSESESFYSCADMNGNVSEWNETKFLWSGLQYRVNRGGDYSLDESIMEPGHFGIVLPHHEASTIGFRVVRTLP